MREMVKSSLMPSGSLTAWPAWCDFLFFSAFFSYFHYRIQIWFAFMYPHLWYFSTYPRIASDHALICWYNMCCCRILGRLHFFSKQRTCLKKKRKTRMILHREKTMLNEITSLIMVVLHVSFFICDAIFYLSDSTFSRFVHSCYDIWFWIWVTLILLGFLYKWWDGLCRILKSSQFICGY